MELSSSTYEAGFESGMWAEAEKTEELECDDFSKLGSHAHVAERRHRLGSWRFHAHGFFTVFAALAHPDGCFSSVEIWRRKQALCMIAHPGARNCLG